MSNTNEAVPKSKSEQSEGLHEATPNATASQEKFDDVFWQALGSAEDLARFQKERVKACFEVLKAELALCRKAVIASFALALMAVVLAFTLWLIANVAISYLLYVYGINVIAILVSMFACNAAALWFITYELRGAIRSIKLNKTASQLRAGE